LNFYAILRGFCEPGTIPRPWQFGLAESPPRAESRGYNLSKTQLIYDTVRVDDQIAGLSAYVAALKSAGLNVTTADKTEDAVKLAEQGAFGVVLVDIRMPPPDGIECLSQFHRLRPSAKFATLSSYHYLERYKTQLRNLDFPVELIDKDFPDTMAPDFKERFLRPIQDLVAQGVTKTIKKSGRHHFRGGQGKSL